MARKSRCQHLLEKSVHAALSAIEIYNKPDFKYREESFSILMVNAWELLLKARILQENKNNLKSIYVIDSNKTRKDGKPFKHPKFKTSRSGNFLTIDITNAIKLVVMVNNWFKYDLNQYNFFLMPISFFHKYEMQSFSINSENEQHQNLLKFIAEKENSFPSDEHQEHNISLILETKWVKSESIETLTSFRYDPHDPNAITYKVDSEEQFKKKYPWNFTDHLKPKLKSRYKNFKMDNDFWALKKNLEKNEKYSKERYLDWNNLKGPKMKFYSTEILKEFDKHYDKK